MTYSPSRRYANTIPDGERIPMMDKIKVFIIQYFQDSEDFESWLDWWYQDESTDDWDDQIEFGGLLWQRSLTSRQQLRQAKYIGQMRENDVFRPARMEFIVIEQNPNAANNKGGRPSEGQQLLEEGHDVAQVIIDGEYVGMIVDTSFHFYPGKGL